MVKLGYLVIVAQWLEFQIVDLAVAGSNPVDHPWIIIYACDRTRYTSPGSKGGFTLIEKDNRSAFSKLIIS